MVEAHMAQKQQYRTGDPNTTFGGLVDVVYIQIIRSVHHLNLVLILFEYLTLNRSLARADKILATRN